MSLGRPIGSGRASSLDEAALTRGLGATRAKLCSRLGCRPVRTRRAALLLVFATAVPRLLALLHERGAILASFTDKGDDFARTFLATGTYGFIPGHPSAYTQPPYGWGLVSPCWVSAR